MTELKPGMFGLGTLEPLATRHCVLFAIWFVRGKSRRRKKKERKREKKTKNNNKKRKKKC